MNDSVDRNLRMARTRASKLGVIVRHREYWSALRSGVAAATEHERVPFTPDLATIVDAGASRGQFALVARRRFPNARLVCFEPLTGSRALLTNVVPDAEVFAVALGSEKGTVVIHVAGEDDSSSLLPLGDRQVSEFPGTREVAQELVDVDRLDELVSSVARPCLLKIDVQGFELEVLRGAERLLPSIDEIYAECSFVELYHGQPLAGEIVGYLGQRGFRLAGVFGVARGLDGDCLQADFLFRRVAGLE